MKCSRASGSISSQKPAFFSLTLQSMSIIHRHTEIRKCKREHISFTFDPRAMFLSLQIGFSFVRAAMACAILERTSGLEPSSETTAPRYLKLVTVPNFCQGFSYLFKSGSRGRLIWEKQLAKIQNWEKRTGESK